MKKNFPQLQIPPPPPAIDLTKLAIVQMCIQSPIALIATIRLLTNAACREFKRINWRAFNFPNEALQNTKTNLVFIPKMVRNNRRKARLKFQRPFRAFPSPPLSRGMFPPLFLGLKRNRFRVLSKREQKCAGKVPIYLPPACSDT